MERNSVKDTVPLWSVSSCLSADAARLAMSSRLAPAAITLRARAPPAAAAVLATAAKPHRSSSSSFCTMARGKREKGGGPA